MCKIKSIYIFTENRIMDNLDNAQYILENGISQAFVVDGQLVMIPALYTDAEIAEFAAMGNFEQVTDYAAYMTGN